MKVVILDGFNGENAVGSLMKEHIINSGDDLTYLQLSQMNIQPCKGCSACSFKTPGECVFKDDTPLLIQGIVNSNLIIHLTPIRFGGYSSTLKKAVDKGGLCILPYLKAKGGKVYHPARYGLSSFFVVGCSETGDQEQFENLKLQVAGNANNIQALYTKVFKVITPESLETFEADFRTAFKEVRKIG